MVAFDRYLIDLGDIETPVRKEPLTTVIEYEWGANVHYTFVVQLNEITLEDQWFPILFGSQTLQVYTYDLETSGKTLNLNGNQGFSAGLVTIDFHFKRDIKQYKRKVLNIFEVVGLVGGIFEILEVTSGFLVSMISY